MKAAATGAWESDPASYLNELRAEFPHFGIVADPARSIWMAVRGSDLFIRASDGFMLRQRLLEISGR